MTSCINKTHLKISHSRITLQAPHPLNYETISSVQLNGHEFLGVHSPNGRVLFLFNNNGVMTDSFILNEIGNEHIWSFGGVSKNRYVILIQDSLKVLNLLNKKVRTIPVKTIFTDKLSNYVTLGILQGNQIPIVEYKGKLVLPRYSMSHSHWDESFYKVPLFSLLDLGTGEEERTLNIGYTSSYLQDHFGAANFFNYGVLKDHLFLSFANSDELRQYSLQNDVTMRISEVDKSNLFSCVPFDTSNGKNLTKMLDHLVVNDLVYDLSFDEKNNVIYQTIWEGAKPSSSNLTPTLKDKGIRVNIFDFSGDFIGTHSVAEKELAMDKVFTWDGKLCFKMIEDEGIYCIDFFSNAQ